MNGTTTYDQGVATEFECECGLGMLHIVSRQQKNARLWAVKCLYAMCPACKRNFYARTHEWGTGRYCDTTLVTGNTSNEVIEKIGQEIVRIKLMSL